MRFFNPTADFKKLLLLEFIEKKPETSQKEIAREIGSAPSMVNVYMNNLEEEGYLERDYQSLKVVYYNITPKGVKMKNFLSITYINELLGLYKLAEQNVEDFLHALEVKGYRKMLMYGAGEASETILGIIKNRESKKLKILAIIDDNKDLQGREILGYQVVSKEDIQNYEHDCILISSYAFEDEIEKQLAEIKYPANKIEKFFSK